MPRGSGTGANGRSGNPARRADARRIAALERETGTGDVDAEREAQARLVAGAEERAVTEMQAATEGVALTGKAEFFGEEFRLADKVGLMPMMKFAYFASTGIGADDMEGMAAMYAVIRDVVYRGEPACGQCEECKAHPDEPGRCPYYDAGDWARFEEVAIDNQADGEELLEFVGEAMGQIAARPTNARSGSSSRARSTSPRSKGTSPQVVPGRRLPPGAEDLRPVEDLLR